MKRLGTARKDSQGQRIDAGDLVRILGVPDLGGMAPKGRRESEPVFRYLVGKVKRVSAFDESGNAELMFRIRKGPMKGIHFVWLEPDLLVKRRSR